MKKKAIIFLTIFTFVAVGLLATFSERNSFLGNIRLTGPAASNQNLLPTRKTSQQNAASSKTLSTKTNAKSSANSSGLRQGVATSVPAPFQLSVSQVNQLNSSLSRINNSRSRFDRSVDVGEDLAGVVLDFQGNVVDILFVPSVFADGANTDPLSGTGFTPEDLFNMGVVEAGSLSSDFYLPDGNTVTGGASDSEGGYWWNVDSNGDGSVDASVHTHGDPDDGASTGDTISYGNSAGDSESGAMYSNNDGVWTAYDDDDIDNDGIGNTPDQDMDGDGIADGQDPDRDGDGALNEHDDEPNNPHQGSSPSENGRGFQNTNYDSDGDGTSDANDTDMDGDGVPNHEDSDTDGDGISNEQDSDDDGDGTPDSQDATPRGKICVGCSAPGSRTSFSIEVLSNAPLENIFNVHLFENISDVVDLNLFQFENVVIPSQTNFR